jgi:hypothetical protein
MRRCPHCGVTLKPERVANLDDLVRLLALCRDCIDTGRPDLARTVLHVIVEHRAELGLRTRNLARHLAEQMEKRGGDDDRAPR